MECGRERYDGSACTRPRAECDDMEWGRYTSLHKMAPGYRWGWQDRPRDMPPD